MITEQGCSKFHGDQGHKITSWSEPGGDNGEDTTLLKEKNSSLVTAYYYQIRILARTADSSNYS